MALGQPLALAALNSAGLRKSQVLRVPVRPVRRALPDHHQLNSLCNRGGTRLLKLTLYPFQHCHPHYHPGR